MRNDSWHLGVALVHHPVRNRLGETSTTAVTSLDVHDFARSCAFFGASPVYIVHPAEGMQRLLADILSHYLDGPGGWRNPPRREAMRAVRPVRRLEDAMEDADWKLWYTSATPPETATVSPGELRRMPGRHLLVFGTGWGLDAARLPAPSGWLSPIEGGGKVRHLSVRAALAIYLDRVLGLPDCTDLEA